jgi:hypothetical protein
MITLKNKVTERSLKNADFSENKKCHILYRRKNVIFYTEEKTSIKNICHIENAGILKKS